MRRRIASAADEVGNRFPTQTHQFKSRLLFTVDVAFLEHCEDKTVFKDAIVWFQTNNLGKEEIAFYVAKLKEFGAVRVKELPPTVSQENLPQAVQEAPVQPHASIRQVVEELTKELPTDVLEGARGIIEVCLTKSQI